MSLYDTLLSTATRYFDAHNNRGLATIAALCDPSCTHTGGPKSVAQPIRNNDEYIHFNAEVLKVLHTYEATLTDILVDEKKRKVALYMTAKASADVGEYENEYVITVGLTEDGTRISSQYEFVGSHEMKVWMEKLGDFANEHWEKKEGS